MAKPPQFIQIAVNEHHVYALDDDGVVWVCRKQQDDICAWQPMATALNPDPVSHSEATGGRAY